jgi:hypothetical protein
MIVQSERALQRNTEKGVFPIFSAIASLASFYKIYLMLFLGCNL